MAERTPARVEEMRRTMSRADWLINTGRRGDECVDGAEHVWQPVSFVFESQLLDGNGRVQIRQPAIHGGRVFLVCMPCHSHTYIETTWVGYWLPPTERFDPDDEPEVGTATEPGCDTAQEGRGGSAGAGASVGTGGASEATQGAQG